MEDTYKALKGKIADLTWQLNEATRRERFKGQTIQRNQHSISSLKKELQKTKQVYNKELKNLRTQIEQERVSYRNYLDEFEESKELEIQELDQMVYRLDCQLKEKDRENSQLNQKIKELELKLYNDDESFYFDMLEERINILSCESKSRKVSRGEIDVFMLGMDGWNSKKARCLHKFGLIYDRMGDYHRAEQCYLRSIHIKNGLDPDCDFASLCNNLGLVYQIMKNYPEAEEYYIKSLMISEAINGPILETTRDNLKSLRSTNQCELITYVLVALLAFRVAILLITSQ